MQEEIFVKTKVIAKEGSRQSKEGSGSPTKKGRQPKVAIPIKKEKPVMPSKEDSSASNASGLVKFSKIPKSPKQKRLWNLQKFILRLLILAIPLYLVISFGIDLGPAQLEVARESYLLIKSSGINAELYGTGIMAYAGGAPIFFVITPDCTGWKAMLFLSALVVAVPKRGWKLRLAGIVPGIVVLWAVNILRVLAVVQVFMAYGLGSAMLVHDILWQIGLGLCALAIWLAWLKLPHLLGRRQ
jgi:exosortase/archaeosortase family protein